MRNAGIAALLFGFSITALLAAETAKPGSASASQAGADADKAWTEFLQKSEMPKPPESWQETNPTQQEIEKFRVSEAARLAKAADLAKDFQSRFPTHGKASQASLKEYELLEAAARLGNTNVLARLDLLDAVKLKDRTLSEDERFQIRAASVERRAMSSLPDDMTAAMIELDKGAHALLKDFPKRPEPFEMLLMVASKSEPNKTKELAKEIIASSAPDELKTEARTLLETAERIGKPLPIKFKAVDGRPVDLAGLKGKVVLVDFWATWCGPCVGEIPNVRATYERLHPKGFEIVGISFDREKESLTAFVDEEKITWPQYFDGKQWENEIGKQFGIRSIPAMWLVDKKGNLRDVNARDDLAEKVEKLLAETQ